MAYLTGKRAWRGSGRQEQPHPDQSALRSGTLYMPTPFPSPLWTVPLAVYILRVDRGRRLATLRSLGAFFQFVPVRF